MTVVGMISGTSYDAIDAALADMSIDGDTVLLHPRGLHSVEIPDAMRARIAACLPPAETTMEEVCRLDTELGQLFGQVAVDAIASLAPDGADLVVSHGQTVFHWVEGRHALGTLQLAAAAWIAEATATTVVSDIRSRDVARGGHGAPLASTLDALMLLDGDLRRGSLNLGGIANITVRGEDGVVIAYDIGPASALMDLAVTELTSGRERMDRGGAMAARGHVDGAVLARLLDEDYYRLPPPKSTGKELFNASYLRERIPDHGLSPDDLLATLTELTARLVADASTAHRLEELVVAGGGLRNDTLMARIADLASPAVVRPLEDFGMPAQAKEAYLFGLLGYLTVHGLDGTIPSATGARRASILGSITPGEGPLVLPEPAATAVRRLRIR
ncbi:MAG: anhydro-N-acetylmuramic acid kinase [Solirubrobacteraceae bacterium]